MIFTDSTVEFDVDEKMSAELERFFLSDKVSGTIEYEVVGYNQQSVRLRIKGIILRPSKRIR